MWSNEKQGGNDFKYDDATMFRNAIDFWRLQDLHFVRHSFTWTNNQGGEKNIQERLDRILANKAWKDMYGGSFVTHLSKRKLDHLPIALSVRTIFPTPTKRRVTCLFRFEEMWTREGQCEEIIREAWSGGNGVSGSMANTARYLREWS